MPHERRTQGRTIPEAGKTRQRAISRNGGANRATAIAPAATTEESPMAPTRRWANLPKRRGPIARVVIDPISTAPAKRGSDVQRESDGQKTEGFAARDKTPTRAHA